MRKQIKKDSKGYAFSLDLLLALIPLTIILGMVAADIDNIYYAAEDTIFRSSTERVGADTVDTLVETSGDPYNWEQTGNAKVIGLAKYDIKKNMPLQNQLSSFKLVKASDSDVQKIVGPEYGFYLNISTFDNPPASIKSLGSYNSSAPDIVRIERIVTSSKLELITSLEGLIRDAGQPRTYSTTFPTNDVYLQAYDYWVLVVNRGYDSATIDVNNNVVVPPDEIKQHIPQVKKQINSTYMYGNTTFIDNIVNVRTVSNPGASMDVYVIAAPLGTPEEDINLENVVPRKCRLQFYIWVR